ncbi:MAG: hypothetical protein K2X01_01780 [Cyanobacteria bacterium]|nr:hypothetical protein [Cyanobacteriota bacterium]
MSDVVETPEKPSNPAAEAPVEKPFNVDILTTCTIRFSRRSWDLFLSLKTDLDKLRATPLRNRLVAKTPDAAQEMHKILVEQGGVSEITTNGNELEFTGTFEAVQLVIKHPQTLEFDAIRLG